MTIFDKEWKNIGTCDFTRLIFGDGIIVHSGDRRQAPYPSGARESVDIDLVKLQRDVPTAAYIVVQVYSFTGVPYGKLFDGSVFISDPSRRGEGPGKEAILTAARLTGEGTCNLAAVVYFDSLERVHLVNVDQTLKVNDRFAASGAGIVSTVCRTIFEDRKKEKARNFLENALLVAATQSKQLAILSNSPEPVCLQRGPQESTFSFFTRARKAVQPLVPTMLHRFPDSSFQIFGAAAPSRVILIHGAMVSLPRLIESLPPSLLQSSNARITSVNVGEPQSTHTAKVFPCVECSVDLITGSNVSRLISSCSELPKKY